MGPVLLIVTWFYGGQPPTPAQATFATLETCNAARQAILNEGVRFRAEADQRIQADRARGELTNPSVPMVSAVCAPQGRS